MQRWEVFPVSVLPKSDPIVFVSWTIFAVKLYWIKSFAKLSFSKPLFQPWKYLSFFIFYFFEAVLTLVARVFLTAALIFFYIMLENSPSLTMRICVSALHFFVNYIFLEYTIKLQTNTFRKFYFRHKFEG